MRVPIIASASIFADWLMFRSGKETQLATQHECRYFD